MKSCNINKLTGYSILILVGALLFACKPLVEPKEHPKKSKEVTSAPAPSASAPAPTPAPSGPAEPVAKIEDVQSIQSLESTVETLDTNIQEIPSSIAANTVQAPVVDDGNDVVKPTPAMMKKIQQALVNAGFNPGPVDGVSGAKTTVAIENFQKQNGIPVGKLTKRTLRALGVDF
jgi:hypothetical protein